MYISSDTMRRTYDKSPATRLMTGQVTRFDRHILRHMRRHHRQTGNRDTNPPLVLYQRLPLQSVSLIYQG
jgi:hypothetical protein